MFKMFVGKGFIKLFPISAWEFDFHLPGNLMKGRIKYVDN